MTRGKHRSATILAVSVLAAVAFLVAIHTDGVSADEHDEPAPAPAIAQGYDWVNQNAVLDMLFLELTGVPWGQTAAADAGDGDGDAGADDELTEEGMDDDADGASDDGEAGSDDGDDEDEMTEVEGPRCYTIAWVGGLWSILVEVPCP